MWKKIDGKWKWGTEHTFHKSNPQSYREHFSAFWNSAKLVVAGYAGMVHGILPWFWPFYTSTVIIESFKSLDETGRHYPEMERILGPEWVEFAKLQKAKRLAAKQAAEAPK